MNNNLLGIELKTKHRIYISVLFVVLFVTIFFNWKYEIIAFNPFREEGGVELKVMTWNVHCSKSADKIRQKKIAELILKEDADFVLLNEFNQDSCKVADSLLKVRYHYIEEGHNHKKSSDIFYSKYVITNSGRIKAPVKGFPFQVIKATIAVGRDSVQIFGVHLMSNQYDGSNLRKKNDLENNCNLSLTKYDVGQEKRCLQAEWTGVEVLTSKHPVIVMGDMNDFNQSKPLNILTSYGLRDSWWEGGNGYGCTYHNGWLRLRIDHILHSDKLKLQNIKVIDTNLSDHNPVIAGFSISK